MKNDYDKNEWPWCPKCLRDMPKPTKTKCGDCWRDEIDYIHNRPFIPAKRFDDNRLTVRLHVFPFYFTTPDQRARLKRDKERPAKKNKHVQPEHAKSRIADSNLATIHPINHVAARVVNCHERQDDS